MIPQIRRATTAEAGALSRLVHQALPLVTAAAREDELAAFLRTVTPEAMAERLGDPGYRYLVARAQGATVGMVGLRERSHLFHLFVDEAWRGRGLGRRLWEAARRDAELPGPVPAYTVNAAIGAIPFYERLGFRCAGPRVEKDGLAFRAMRFEPSGPSPRAGPGT